MQNSVNAVDSIFEEQGLIDIAYQIMTFLDSDTIYSIINPKEVAKRRSGNFQSTENLNSFRIKTHNRNLGLLQSYYLIKYRMNVCDRSMYYSFYQQKQFKEIQKFHQKNIILTETSSSNDKINFASLFQKHEAVRFSIQQQNILNEDEIQQLNRIFVDPSLPAPKIKRQNQGMFCNSSFQVFLVGLRFPHNTNANQFSMFEQAKDKIMENQENYFRSLFYVQKQKNTRMKMYENVHLVRYMPYQITFENYKQLLLKDNSLHNLIIYIFALCDLCLQSIHTYLNNINDPYYKFIETITRYSIYRSFVIELEESLGFLFETYDQLYSDTIRDSIFVQVNKRPKYCFWRPAMTKWFIKINQIHKETNGVYFMLLTKVRQEKLKKKIVSQHGNLYGSEWKLAKKHQMYIFLIINVRCLQNAMQMNQLSQKLKMELEQNASGCSLIEEFVSNNQETLQSLVFEYVQYILDLAINEETVHWCGHSKHKLQKPFTIFNEEFQSYNDRYYRNLLEEIVKKLPEGQSDVRSKILKLMIEQDLAMMQNMNVKSVMLRQVIEEINQKSKYFSQLLPENKIDLKQQEKTQQSQSENLLITLSFHENDSKLLYWNQRFKILQSIQGQQKCFFSIPPLLSPQEILTKSINTNDTSQGQEDQQGCQSFQYVSDRDQNQQDFIGQNMTVSKNLQSQLMPSQSSEILDKQITSNLKIQISAEMVQSIQVKDQIQSQNNLKSDSTKQIQESNVL